MLCSDGVASLLCDVETCFFVSGILCAYQFCFGGVCDVMFCVLFLGVCFLGGYLLGEIYCCFLMLF